MNTEIHMHFTHTHDLTCEATRKKPYARIQNSQETWQQGNLPIRYEILYFLY